jgi:hypothetical protein
MPPSSTGRRPKRSASGPQTSIIAAKPAMNRPMVSCASAALASRSAAMPGSEGS